MRCWILICNKVVSFQKLQQLVILRDQDYLDKKIGRRLNVLFLIAAQHQDDVVPVSLYYDTNIGGIERH